MSDPIVYNKELGKQLDDGIKQAFSFPFSEEGVCQPDGSKHVVPDRTFNLNGYLVVLYDIRLFPGLTFQALEANTGDLNVFTQEAKFEIGIPTIGGFFYVVSEDKSLKPEHITGTFKINYHSAIAKGIIGFLLTDDEALGISNLAMDFELMEKPSVTLNPEEANSSMGPFDSDSEVHGAKVAEVLWPSVHPLLYWILRDKLWDMSSKMSWNYEMGVPQFKIHETRRRSKVTDMLDAIIEKVTNALNAKMYDGGLQMPNIDVMVAPIEDPETWGRFMATSGWLGNATTMEVTDAAVHAKNQNELVIVGQLKFDDWRYCYGEFTVETNNGNGRGEIIKTLDDNEAVITITATRNSYGLPVLKNGRFEYINATNTNIEITGTDDFDWLETYVNYWMSGLMDANKPILNKVITDCLNEALVDADVFSFWDELNNTTVNTVPLPRPIGFVLP